ncbi:MAG: hypothetical protein A3B70_04365 [Deltaproteobacteria bacterium RIFCSPHIGHO2_02_FULL_40_11]|nr:MAG: hypothetical protein A3B70_04365 [Deltaproteobacteria bacterium RIFCSPHIGHO2_02_FULL_40_11]
MESLVNKTKFVSFLMLIIFLNRVNLVFSTDHFNGLIPPGYGIVTDDDLAYDAARRIIPPYEPNNEFSGALYWQCVPKRDVVPKYTTWRGNDPMGAWDKIITLCAFEISIHREGEVHRYISRRALPVETCRLFMNEWKTVTLDQDIVCLNGEGGSYSKSKEKYRYWTWEKFKTKKGCFSYFHGYCNTSGYSKK